MVLNKHLDCSPKTQVQYLYRRPHFCENQLLKNVNKRNYQRFGSLFS